MNRAEVLAAYTVDANGIIRSPGKFEGEMLYVPALWDIGILGGAAFDEGGVYGYIFDESDHEEFPEIGSAVAILMEESDTGFVTATEFKTLAEWYRACAVIELPADTDEEDENG